MQVSPTTGAAIPYTEGGETAAPTTPVTGTPAVPTAGNLVPGVLPEQPVSGGGRAIPGVAPEAAPPALPTPEAAPGAGGGVAGPGGVVAPSPVPTGTPNANAAEVWAGRASEPKALSRALARLGVQVTGNRKEGTVSNSGLDGALYLNCTPSGEEIWDNASLNEELWHLVNLMTLKAEWEDQGSPGDLGSFKTLAPPRWLLISGGRRMRYDTR